MHRQRAANLERTDAQILDIYTATAGGNRELFRNEMRSEAYLPLAVARSWNLIHCLSGEAVWRNGRPYYFP
jgi:hypothetical protein